MIKDRKKFHILIVDDHPATRKLLSDILCDYHVISASNGKEALEKIVSERKIDIVLLDIIMPEMNGYEVCSRIKERPESKDIPIIFLTKLDEDKDEAKGFASGVTDYIIKPVSRLRLLARIENQLQLKVQRQLLENKNKELQEALDQIKTLRGILPICSFCKQIRNDQGYWQQVEEYIRVHSEAQFSHSICPRCMDKHYSEFSCDQKD